MKKILGISLVAMMSVTAANAEIASRAYVDQQDNSVKALITAEGTARTDADTAINTKIGTLPYINGESGDRYADVITYIDAKATQASGENSTLAGRVTTAEGDIDAIETKLGETVAADFTKLHGVTADVNEINVLDGITATTTELNYVDGVTSNIQTQLDAKQATANMITSTDTTGENAINQTATDKYPSMATAKAIADAAAANAVNSSVSIASATNGVSASVSNGAITMAGTDATTSAKGVMQVGTDLAVADGVVSVDKSTTVASADTKPVSSGAVYTALHNFAGAPVANDTDGVYALTAVVTDGVATYHWELIARETPAETSGQ